MRRNYGLLFVLAVILFGFVGSVHGDPAGTGAVQPERQDATVSMSGSGIAVAEGSRRELASFALDMLAGLSASSLSETEASQFQPPGHGGTPPGQGGIPPGQTSPPGQGGTPPGQRGTPPD